MKKTFTLSIPTKKIILVLLIFSFQLILSGCAHRGLVPLTQIPQVNRVSPDKNQIGVSNSADPSLSFVVFGDSRPAYWWSFLSHHKNGGDILKWVYKIPYVLLNPVEYYELLNRDPTANKSVRIAVIQAITKQLDSTNLVIHVGDIVQNGSYPKQWQRFYQEFLPLFRALGKDKYFYAVLGNHDVTDQYGISNLANTFKLTNPGDGYPIKMINYSRKLKNTLFVFLDSQQFFGDLQGFRNLLEYTDKALQDSTALYKIVVMHHPPFSSGNHWKQWQQIKGRRKEFVRLLVKHRVDLLLAGHDHFYERSELKYLDPHTKKEKSLIFVTTGGAGSPLQKIRSVTERENIFQSYNQGAFGFLDPKEGFLGIIYNPQNTLGMYNFCRVKILGKELFFQAFRVTKDKKKLDQIDFFTYNKNS